MRHRWILITLLLGYWGQAAAADVAKGHDLHQQNCLSCHSSMTGGKPNSLYTRDNRRVNSLAGLNKQVRRCELSLGLKWFDDDINNVAAYLNETFYHLKK